MNLINVFCLFIILSTTAFAQSDVSAPQVVAPGQPAAVQNTAAATAPVVAPTGPAQPSTMGFFLPMLGMLALMYFFMIRPQQKRMKVQQELHKGLQNGDEVVTNAGIIGTITGMSEKVVTLEISKNVQMKILRSQVNQVVKGQISEIQQ
ncbi:MAG: preprotein translocase subunit YajC [Bdellovibrionales bacterium]|nr:preprotein translocase subunit YajC [Bdellovibrionales bacterium]